MRCVVCGKLLTQNITDVPRGTKALCSERCRKKWQAARSKLSTELDVWPFTWKPEENRFIEENWQHMTDAEMSIILKRTKEAVGKQRKKIGFGRVKEWTDEDKQFLRDNWQRMSDKGLASHFDVSEMTIKRRRFELDLFRQGPHKKEGKQQ